MTTIVLLAVIIVLVAVLIVLVILVLTKKTEDHSDELKTKLIELNAELSKMDPLMRNEFRNNREESQKSFMDNRTEQSISLKEIRDTMERRLQTLQDENSKKLEDMRKVVDEKLQETVEKRFNESFKFISDRLELVHKGLGEMQTLATSVGDLKKVMTNVKSRGVLGEYQLANILEDLLTNEQYEKNVKTKVGSGAIVEFAIKLPNNNNLEKTLWLPIDSKFPKEDYETLVDAYEESDLDKIDERRKAFKNAIIKNAKDIKEKYLDPPNTTEYGIMFLPFESLYAEVLRTPGLFDQIYKDYKVTITGPTTLGALLNSLQMGFRTLAIQKRSSEVWDVLGAVKTAFANFGDVLERTKKKLQQATDVIEDAGRKSKTIERKLRTVQELPQEQTLRILGEEMDWQADEGVEAEASE